MSLWFSLQIWPMKSRSSSSGTGGEAAHVRELALLHEQQGDLLQVIILHLVEFVADAIEAPATRPARSPAAPRRAAAAAAVYGSISSAGATQ